MQPAPIEDSVFASGADLWIVPERKKSTLVQKLDWYLNFQISKAVQHQPQTLAPAVLDILKSCALEGYDWAPEENNSLLILSSHVFPNRWVLVLRGSEQLENWAETAVAKWKSLNRPSIRVFLPHDVSISQFEKLWKKAGGSEDVPFVADSTGSDYG